MTKGEYIEWTKELAGFCRWFQKKYNTESFHLGKFERGEYFIVSPVLDKLVANRGKRWPGDNIIKIKEFKKQAPVLI